MQSVYEALAKTEEQSDNFGLFLIALLVILVVMFLITLLTDGGVTSKITTGILLVSLSGTVIVGENTKAEREEENRVNTLEDVYPSYLRTITPNTRYVFFNHSSSIECDFEETQCIKASFISKDGEYIYINLPLRTYDKLKDSQKYKITYPNISSVDVKFINTENIPHVVFNNTTITPAL